MSWGAIPHVTLLVYIHSPLVALSKPRTYDWYDRKICKTLTHFSCPDAESQTLIVVSAFQRLTTLFKTAMTWKIRVSILTRQETEPHVG